MKRFKNILVLHNNRAGDEATLRRATRLARRNRARLTIMEVLDERTEPTLQEIEQHELQLRRIASSIRQDAPLHVNVLALTGKPFLEIIRHVLTDGIDLVMLTADGPGGWRHAMFGSTSMHLMRKCPCPVWVTQGPYEQYRGILAAVDPAHGPGERDDLNHTILQLASSLARREGSDLHVVHAWQLRTKEADTAFSEITEEMHRLLMKRAAAPHRQRLDDLLAAHDLEGLPVHVHLRPGRPEEVISQVASQNGVELIVMGTLCRTGVPGFFIGNTAETVLQEAGNAVLTVKPSGFVTPVTNDHGLPLHGNTADVA